MKMEWSEEAESAVRKVPLFVRKRVRARVEREAAAEGKHYITLAEVQATQKRFLAGMSREVQGYRLEACFGGTGCPNRAAESDTLYKRLDALFRQADLLSLLKERVRGDLKLYHEFGITLADCPNACSRPQIRDLGIIGAATPAVTDAPCTACEACIQACRESAIRLAEGGPVIDMAACLHCGACAAECPSGTLRIRTTGFRVLIGGKLGRHPRLGVELPGIHSADEVMEIARACIDFYRRRSIRGERFAALLSPSDLEDFISRFGK